MSENAHLPSDSFSEKLIAWCMITLAVGIGGVSLVAFGIFVLAGSPRLVELNLSLWGGLAMNTGLSLLFFVQHSGMTRRSFKQWMARFVPRHYTGAVYAIASGVTLLAVVLLWQESQYVIAAASGYLWWLARVAFFLAVCGLAWGAVSLKGFDTLGLTPILRRNRAGSASSPALAVRGPYRWVRHPLYFFVLVMIWSQPYLTVDRLLFNALWSLWIVFGAVLEERDLVAEFGDGYRVYQSKVPMLIPRRLVGWIGPNEDSSGAGTR